MADPKVSALITAKNEAKGALLAFKGSLLGILAVVGSLTVAFVAFKKLTDKVVEAASRQEETEIRLAGALATVGENTEEARDQLNRYLSTLEDVTTIGSDQIAKTAAQLIQLGGLTGETLNDAIEVTLGLSAVTGRAADSIAINIAKAAKGMAAGLSQYGIAVDASLSKTEQFSRAMVDLRANIGEGAKILGLGFAGALRRIDNDLDNLNKALGKAIIESAAFQVVLEAVSKAIQIITGFLQQNPQIIGLFVEAIAKAVIFLIEMNIALANQVRNMPRAIALWITGSEWIAGMAQSFVEARTESDEFLDKMEFVGGGVAFILSELSKQIKDALGKTTKAAEEVGNVVAKAKAPLELLGELFETNVGELGVESFESLEEKARLVNEAWAALAALQAQTADGFSDPKIVFYQDKLVELALALQEAGFEFGFLTEVMAKANDELKEQAESVLSAQGFIDALSLDVVDQLEGQARAGALSFGDALIDAATGGEKAFKKFFQALLRDIARAIIQALVLKAITAAIGGFGGGGIGPLGIPLSGSVVGLQRGGRVRGEAIGRDSVRALLKPGEVVLPESLAGDFSSIAAFASELRSGRGAPAGAGSFGNVTIPLTVVGGDDDARLANLIERLNDAVTRSGFTLIASETTV